MPSHNSPNRARAASGKVNDMARGHDHHAKRVETRFCREKDSPEPDGALSRLAQPPSSTTEPCYHRSTTRDVPNVSRSIKNRERERMTTNII
jgi:hypothetical protein